MYPYSIVTRICANLKLLIVSVIITRYTITKTDKKCSDTRSFHFFLHEAVGADVYRGGSRLMPDLPLLPRCSVPTYENGL